MQLAAYHNQKKVDGRLNRWVWQDIKTAKEPLMRLHHLFTVALTLSWVGSAAAGDEEAAIKKTVLGAQEAGWGRHDFDAYMQMWSEDAVLVIARAEKEGPRDSKLTLRQIRDTRRILLSGKPPKMRR